MMPGDYNLRDSTCEQDSLNLVGLTSECRYLGLYIAIVIMIGMIKMISL